MTNEERDYFERIASSLNDIAMSLRRQNELKALEVKGAAHVNSPTWNKVEHIMKGA